MFELFQEPIVQAESSSFLSFNGVHPEKTHVTIPAEEWELMVGAYSGDLFSEAPKGTIPSVRVRQHGGHLYTVFSTLYGGRSGVFYASAWQLMPVSTVASPVAEDAAQVPERGDYRGALVKARRQVMVCSKPVDFHRGLPTVKPLLISEAVLYDESCRGSGWRSGMFSSKVDITWWTLAGHPVVCYENQEGCRVIMLFWRNSTVMHADPMKVDLCDLTPAFNCLPAVTLATNNVPNAEHFQQTRLFA